jgi:hypothetical protein
MRKQVLEEDKRHKASYLDSWTTGPNDRYRGDPDNLGSSR